MVEMEDNYYQLLNVARTASAEEINSAYRRCSRLFHPDKHNDGTNRKKWAEVIFNKVKQAYEVLSDPRKRAIYDTLGMKGLEVDGWEVALRTHTPGEIRKEYERLKREQEEKRLRQSANPNGAITLSINATDIFTKYHDEYDILEDSAIIPNIEVSGMSIAQSVEAPVSFRNTLTLSGDVSTQNGTGNGSLTLSNRHWTAGGGCLELQCGIGNGPQFGISLHKNISRLMFLNCGTSLEFTSRGIAPSFVSTLARQLDARSVGYTTYKTDGKGGGAMIATFVRDSEKYHLNASVQLGNPHSFISFDYMRKMPELGLKVRLSLKFGTFGGIVEYGADKKVSQNSIVSAAVMLGVPSGVTLKLKWTCSSQSIIVPIHLCEEIVPAPVFYATLVPVVSWLLLKQLILDPIAKERRERERQRTMEAHSERLLEMQQEACAMVELMRETYMRNKSEEKKKKGLVIVKALYGKLPAGASNHEISEEHAGDSASSEPLDSNTEVIDVTIPIQCIVKDSRLELLEDSKIIEYIIDPES